MQIRADTLPDELQERVADVAFNICRVGTDGAILLTEYLRNSVAAIHIRQQLRGGRSGAVVVDADIIPTGPSPVTRRVIIKIDMLAAVEKEWRAITRTLGTDEAELTVPVLGISDAIASTDQHDEDTPWSAPFDRLRRSMTG